MKDIDRYLRIADNFLYEGKILTIEPYGDGLINDTFRITTSEEAPDYMLQRINHSVFRNVAMLQDNIRKALGDDALNWKYASDELEIMMRSFFEDFFPHVEWVQQTIHGR